MKQQTDNPLDENGYPIYGSFSSKKQTAVEWLIEQLIKADKELDSRRKNEDATILKLNPTKIFEQAKAMEKERIEDTYWDAYKEGQCSSDKTAEEYYDETFNK